MINNNYDEIIEYLEKLIDGYNPITGEELDYKDLIKNKKYASIIDSLAKDCESTIKMINYSSGVVRADKAGNNNVLNRNINMIIEELREWRYLTSKEEGVPPYVIFRDEVLYNIAAGDVCKKEELKLIKGIAQVKYDKYADEIFDILSKYIKEDDEDILSSKLTRVNREKENLTNWKEKVNSNTK